MTKNKKDVIKLLENIAVYMELKGENPFKIAAYRRAAQALERDERSLTDIDDFTKIKGIGKGTSAVIEEYLQEDTSETLRQLQEEVPEGLVPLLNIPGLGGKKLAKLYQELQVIDGESLKAALEDGRVEKLAGFGEKSAKKILAALDEVGSRPERIPIAIMLPIAEKIEERLARILEIDQFARAGSLRRMRETIKDLDFIIATKKPSEVRDALLNIPGIKEVIAEGETKVSITLADVYDINVDFRLVNPPAFATTLHHFTGSKDHNVAMRQLAKSKGQKISEYGVHVDETDETLTFANEVEFFHHFDLPYIPPEIREGDKEFHSLNNEKPLIALEDIQGDLHMHTTWSDGAQSVEEMVAKAREKGYAYIAITDHSKNLRVANGLNESRLRKQREDIERLNAKYRDIHVFAGVEMDILPDGKLDFSTDFLKEMDFVIGAIHSAFNQTEDQIMYRLFTALENPFVNLIAHPTGRLIGRREGYAVNMESLLARAKETNTALEVNANPNRLDLSARWVEEAIQQGIPIAINTDAHNYAMLDHMQYGVGIAKKGWANKELVINTWSKEKLFSFFNRNR
ncbi:DNA polymerase/3'-5' exonuclease PolX [Virgibacillus sp. LDC-1]|uniref:DNA polymerase/3'-5' exonuclease PolX n=1 Tax=Virgibacillus sp. LDC-1 TaxID=3039856 RepID=UPI0024DE36DB|nr:DNA polymerase/3'-5' exonuclease PolX [Virgibacillus sp. LDC-1]